MAQELTHLARGTRGEFVLTTEAGSRYRLALYAHGSTARRTPAPGGRPSQLDGRPVLFFGTIDPVRIGVPAVFILSARENWRTSRIVSIRRLRGPCQTCGGPDVLQFGRCWRCRWDPRWPERAYARAPFVRRRRRGWLWGRG